MNKGYVYVLSNPAMPGYYKVGRSMDGGRARAKTIYQTGVPEPFVVEFEALFQDCVAAESEIHDRLQEHRENKSREFFRCELEVVLKAVAYQVAFELDMYLIEGEYLDALDACGEFAGALNEHPFVVSAALKFINSTAVSDAIARYNSWVEQRRSLRANG